LEHTLVKAGLSLDDCEPRCVWYHNVGCYLLALVGRMPAADVGCFWNHTDKRHFTSYDDLISDYVCQSDFVPHSRKLPCFRTWQRYDATSDAFKIHSQFRIFGLFLIVAPGAGALGLTWVIGAYAIVWGVLLIILASRLRNLPRDDQAIDASRASRV
jgi:hypothetical protein